MEEIRWELYPLVATSERSRAWLQLQNHLQLAPKTIDAYGRSLNDFLTFCQCSGIVPETITREQVGLYVHDLAHRPNPKGAKLLSIESGRVLSNSTMQQRITVLRLFCDSLVERQLRQDNPVGRGHYVAGRAFGGARSRGLLPRYHKLPWLPSDEQWQNVLRSLEGELLRNQVMLLIAYDGALRREELVRLEVGDFDFAYQQIRVRAEHAKNGHERIVGYGKATSRLLEAYIRQRRALSAKRGPLFLSESHRNASHPHGPRTPRLAPDRHLRGSHILNHDHALHPLERHRTHGSGHPEPGRL